jgi:hypothetical protein
MFCTGCGTQAIEDDTFCGGCGSAQRAAAHPTRPAVPANVFHVGQEMRRDALPEGVRGWSWGAFLLNWIWAVGNNTWIGLLALIPFVNIPVLFWLGMNGREMAWRNRRWDSIDHFKRVQRQWSQWAICIALTHIGFVIMMILMMMIAGSSGGGTHATDEADDTVVQQVRAAPEHVGS